jgi:hypothetical protein
LVEFVLQTYSPPSRPLALILSPIEETSGDGCRSINVGTGRIGQSLTNPEPTATRGLSKTEKKEWEEQELRARFRREQEERRFKEQGVRGNQRGDVWKWKGTQSQEEHCFNCNLTGHLRKDCVNPPFCHYCKKTRTQIFSLPREKKG